MKVYKLQRSQFIKASLNDLWSFFSDPRNLVDLTPAYMQFTITTDPLPAATYAGQIITYHVSPLFGMKMFWMTEITQVVDGKYFVDEQRVGPYKLWHHEHHFIEHDGGILMTDIVHYSLPFHFLGSIAHNLFIRKQLNDIFEYRFRKIEERYNLLGNNL